MGTTKFCAVALSMSLLTASAGATLVTTDETWFKSQYTNPAHIIDFTALRDGSTFASLRFGSSPLVYFSISLGPVYVVHDDAWSTDFLLGSYRGSCFGVQTAVRWTSPGHIAPHLCSTMYFSMDQAHEQAVAMYSGSTFMGLVPDSTDGMFASVPAGITEIRYGFQAVQPDPPAVPEPVSLALAMLGIAGIAGIAAARRKASRQ